jgi:hypothetical protein
MKGPIDYLIVGFDGLKFDGSIMQAIGDAVDSGVINVLALSVIAKNADGEVQNLNIADIGDAYIVEYCETHTLDNELITADDLNEVGDLLVEDSAAGLLIIEHLWAKPLKKALIDANGFLIAEGRIHPGAAAEINAGGEQYGIAQGNG